MKSLALLTAAAAAAALAGGGCGGGGHLSGSGGAGQIMTGSGGVGLVGGSGTGGGPGMSCGDNSMQAQRLPPDILIVLDTSVSMNDAFDAPCAGACDPVSKWDAAVSAVDSLTGAARPVASWGLKLIADGTNACDTGGIAVPIGTPGNPISAALASRSSANLLATPGNRPLRAAIEVAAAQLSARAPGPPHIILLVTDGVPDCRPGETDPLASDAAGAAQAVTLASAAGITTYVVGVGTLAADADAALGQLARAGGLARAGTPAYAPAPARSDLMTASDAFVTRTTACTFAVPEPPNSLTDRGHIDLQLMGGDGFVQPISRDPMNGWDYTDSSLRGVQLHGSACDVAGGGAWLEISFPCVDLG